MKHPHLRSAKTGFADLTGQRFGRWLVLERGGQLWPQTTWRCRCDCGQVKDAVLYANLVSGQSRSCGCLRSEKRPTAVRSGMGKSKVHAAWSQMKQRCYNQARREWRRYGGRGITVCDRWRDSFENFRADMGDPPKGHSLDRINNDGNYEPANCRWADVFTQQGNRRNTHRFPWRGEAKTLTEIALMENVAFCSLRNKVKIYGMTVEQAVAECRARGLTFKERARAQRPIVVTQLAVLGRSVSMAPLPPCVGG